MVTLSGAGQGYFDQVFCYSPDRLSRDAINQLLYEREIRDLGKEIIFVSESSDDTPEGHFIRIIRAGVSQYERELIRRRTMRGRVAAFTSGRYAGGQVPYGYKWGADSGWTIEPEQAQVVRKVFDDYLRGGKGMRDIAESLTNEGVPRVRGGSRWRENGVRRILTQTAYVSGFDSLADYEKYAATEHWTQMPNFPPILVDDFGAPDIQTWNRVQLKRKSNRRGGVGRKIAKWPFQGLARCGLCGRTLRCYRNSGGKGTRVYCCPKGKERYLDEEPCQLPRISATLLENAIAQGLTQALGDPEALHVAASAFLAELNSQIEKCGTGLDPIIDAINSTTKQLEKVRRLYIDDSINEQQMESLANPLESELSRLNQSISSHRESAEKLNALQETRDLIEKCLDRGTLKAVLRSAGDLDFREARTNDAIAIGLNGLPIPTNTIKGINSTIYSNYLGGMSLAKTLRTFDIEIDVNDEHIDVRGRIPFSVPTGLATWTKSLPPSEP